MTKTEIREEIENLDYEVFSTIIECCKELFIDGVPICNWDIDMVMSRFESATEDWED